MHNDYFVTAAAAATATKWMMCGAEIAEILLDECDGVRGLAWTLE